MPQNKVAAAMQNTRECTLEIAETDAAILKAETEYAMNGILYNARNAFGSLRRKYFSHIHNI